MFGRVDDAYGKLTRNIYKNVYVTHGKDPNSKIKSTKRFSTLTSPTLRGSTLAGMIEKLIEDRDNTSN